jgi:hypothetical protein
MTEPDSPGRDLHIICERDVGFFSLFQQVVANIPWAVSESRTPVVFFWDRCCYWTPEGMEGRESVWEYYFEPLVPGVGESAVSEDLRVAITSRPPDPFSTGYPLGQNGWVSSHFGDHKKLRGKALSIPYEWEDPDFALRRTTEDLIRRFVRPRPHIAARVEAFADAFMAGQPMIGAHIRGTDAVSSRETRAYRQGSLSFDRYVRAIETELHRQPSTRVFVATDSEESLRRMRVAFGERVLAFDSIRHTDGDVAGSGPTGWTMPGYISGDRSKAARNAAEAVIEYLLLTRCQHLIHNGAGLARTVLLTSAALPHTNVHGGGRVTGHLRSLRLRAAQSLVGKALRSSLGRVSRE